MYRVIVLVIIMVMTCSGCYRNSKDVAPDYIDSTEKIIDGLVGDVNYIQNQLELKQDDYNELEELYIKINNDYERLKLHEAKKNDVLTAISAVKGNQYTLVEIDTSNLFETTEGSTLNVHLEDNEIKYFDLWFYGEMGKNLLRYYIINESKLYVEDTLWQYEEPFESQDAEIIFEMYYFEGTKGFKLGMIDVVFEEVVEDETTGRILEYKDKVYDLVIQ